MEIADPLCRSQGKRYDLVEARCVGKVVKVRSEPKYVIRRRVVGADRWTDTSDFWNNHY